MTLVAPHIADPLRKFSSCLRNNPETNIAEMFAAELLDAGALAASAMPEESRCKGTTNGQAPFFWKLLLQRYQCAILAPCPEHVGKPPAYPHALPVSQRPLAKSDPLSSAFHTKTATRAGRGVDEIRCPRLITLVQTCAVLSLALLAYAMSTVAGCLAICTITPRRLQRQLQVTVSKIMSVSFSYSAKRFVG